MTGLKIYDGIINTALLNEIIAFVLDTAGADYSQRKELTEHCIFYDPQADGNAVQDKYSFLYLGELLERYEERFGMPKPDLRAIALALGYTHDLLTDEMFVGTQKSDFWRKVQREGSGDIYLMGALSQRSADQYAPTDWPVSRTEELLFAMSLHPDFSQAAQRLKPQLTDLLGKGRTMPVMGNEKPLEWLTAQAAPVIKTLKGKDYALLRALCALSSSYVKPGSKHHGLLLEHGWSALEIAWANAWLALEQRCLSPQSMVTEKIMVGLFREVLAHKEPLTEEAYAYLTELFSRYQHFHIKCYGCEKLPDTLLDCTIQDPATFAWFGKLVDIRHPALGGFDILDPKWDSLSSTFHKYRALFELHLCDDMDAGDIKTRIGRYDALTGGNYLAYCAEESYSTHFGLMVSKGLIDLWQTFQDSLDGEGSVTRPDTRGNISRYLKGLPTIQAYQFYQTFFQKYGMAGLQSFFGWEHRNFRDSLVKQSHYYSDVESLNLQRDFLDKDGHRQLLDWLQAYYYIYEPDKYARLVVLVLRDEFAAGLLSREEQLALFNFVIVDKELVRSCERELKQRYMTEAQLQTEREARAAAEQEAEKQKRTAEAQAIREELDKVGGSFAGTLKILDGYSYRYYRDRLRTACHIVRDDLSDALEGRGYQLAKEELAPFLKVCAALVDAGNMGLTDLQDYMLRLKECEIDDTTICRAS